MHRSLLTVLVALLIAVCSTAQDCTWCQSSILEEQKVHWQNHAFCGEDCRHQWYLDRYRCKICNLKVTPKSSSTTRTDGMFIYMDFSPKTWDGFCDSCREGVKEGFIDPVKDRYQEPKDPDVPNGMVANPAPIAETREPEADDSGGFVFGILKWVVGLGIVFVVVLKKLLG